MEPVSHRFRNLSTCIDELHELFDAWTSANPFAPILGAYGLEVTRLALHEWIANLVQHADFSTRAPLVEIVLEPHQERLRCRIADNSSGFDFSHQLAVQRAMVRSGFAHGSPPERGRGLMMLAAFTEGLAYANTDLPGDAPPDALRQHVEFWIASTGTPPASAPTDASCRIPF